MKGRFLPGRLCPARTLAYDFETMTGRLYLPTGCCCDMRGCVQLFLAIDAKVRRIETYAGDKQDTRYERRGTAQWRAVLQGAAGDWAAIELEGGQGSSL